MSNQTINNFNYKL